MKSICIKTFMAASVLLLFVSCNSESQREIDVKTMIYMAHSVQESNEAQYYRGSGYLYSVRAEFSYLNAMGRKEDEYKKNAVKSALDRFDKIDLEMKKVCDYITGLKKSLLSDANESIQTFEIGDPNGLIVTNFAFQELKEPTTTASITIPELQKKIIQLKDDLTQLTGTYEWGGKDFYCNSIKTVIGKTRNDINNGITWHFKDQDDQINPDDVEGLIEINLKLTQASMELKSIDPQTLIGSLSVLTSVESNILDARATALGLWKQKISTGEFSFNKFEPIVEGPEAIKSGQGIDLTLALMVHDDSNPPIVTIENNPNAKISYREGKATISLANPKVGILTLRGTISIKNKSGVVKVRNWEKTIEVIQ
ncbi:MAG: hypothetical protein HRT57_00535 [Crocinitomicaceae bacterium]|nr:hypothetical protein [Crocinitomicaceae bacterium]